VSRNKLAFLGLAFAAPAFEIANRNICFMAAPADYLDAADLKNVLSGGLVREDVLNDIFDISDIGTPFLDMIGSDGFTNPYSEWTEDKLVAPSLTNAAISGKDVASTENDATVANALRVGNHAQISTKEIMVTTRGQATNNIGRSDEMGFQTARRLQELRRDVEAIALSGQASVADDNNVTAGKSAGLGAWIKTNLSSGAGGSSPGFQTGTKLVSAQVPGEGRGLTMTLLSAQIENVYNLGGNTTVLMSVPGVTKRLAQYLFTTPYAAKPTQNVDGTGSGVNQTSQGFIDAFKTDFGFYMQLVPNRLQQLYADAAGGVAQNVANVYGIDPRYLRLSTLYGWKVDALGKIGLQDRKLASVDWMLKVLLERAHFNIADINPTTAVVA
jgi:hypothetical protein